MSNFPYKNPLSSVQSVGVTTVPTSATFGTSYSVNNTGGYMEVYSLSDLIYTIPTGTTGSIEYSGNTIPVDLIKGNGNVWSPDVLTLGSDNISSGRRRLGMLAYVYEEDQVYQFNINNYTTLWNNATGSTNCVVISDFGTTIKSNTSQGQLLISAWTASTIEGVNGYTSATAAWRKFNTGTGGGGSGFTSVRINNTTQFTSSSNSFINFSGTNVNITSVGNNTLLFSAGTGGGGGGSSNLQYFITGSTPSGVTVNSGDRWFDTNTGAEVVYINDGDSSQWVRPSNGMVPLFTGNTSATCITSLYVRNIYGCSPININDLVRANSGLTTTNLTATTISATTYYNLPFSGTVIGNGAPGYVTKWDGSGSGLTDSQIYDDGAFIGIGATTPVYHETFSIQTHSKGIAVDDMYILPINGSIALATGYDYSVWGTGSNEIAIGTRSPLSVSTGHENIAIGDKSLASNTTGAGNVAIGGTLALWANTTGYSNTVIGSEAMSQNTIGYQNTAIGGNSLRNNISGLTNVAIGYAAGYSNVSGSSNVYIGNTSGYLNNGTNNIFIGNAAGYSDTASSNKLNIGETIFGNTLTKLIGINQSSPVTTLDVNGTLRVTSGLTASTISATTYQNLPFSGSVTGSGTTGYLPKWTGSTGLSNSLVYDSTTGVTIGTGFTWDNSNSDLQINGKISVGKSNLGVTYNPLVFDDILDPFNAAVSATQIYPKNLSNKRLFFGTSTRLFQEISFSGVSSFSNLPGTSIRDGLALSWLGGGPTVTGGAGIPLRFNSYWGYHFRNDAGVDVARIGYSTTDFKSTFAGNVIIGSTADTGTYKLDVSGFTRVSGLTSTNGMYSISAYTGSYTDGIVADYVTGNGRISVGTGDTITFYNGGVAVTPLMTITSGGTLLIGTTTDAGYRLDVSGTSRFTGNITPEANINMYSTGTTLKRIQPYWGGSIPYGLSIEDTGTSVGGIGNGYGIRLGNVFSVSHTLGEYNQTMAFTNSFSPISGTGILNLFTIKGVINQTGGANGITRGLYVQPTLTSAADFRAIETTVGNVILNGTSGNTIIGKTTDSGQKLQVSGNTLIQGSLTATTFSGTSSTISGTKGTVNISGSSTTAFIEVTGSNTVGGTGYTDFIRVTNTAAGATNSTKTIRVNITGGIEFLNSTYLAQTLTLTDGGILSVGCGNTAVTANNDPGTNYLSFNGNSTSIYDDGNTHIHARGNGNSMWINTNNAGIIIGGQSPVLNGGAASGIIMGSGSTTIRAFANIYGGKTYTIGGYGYLATIGAGTGAGTTATYGLYVQQRVEASEFDATSDERLKDIQGEIELNDAIKLVTNLKPIKYTWKDKDNEGVKAGYSAQQVVKSGFNHLIGHIKNENLIETTDDEGFTSPEGFQLTMNYDQVTPYHGVVIKHLLEEIEKLKEEIKELKNKVG